MTSSLVGSEMCIRDRQKNMHNVLAAVGVPPAAPKILPQIIDMPTIQTVSYTHLTLPTICSV
eukprot:9074757-Prorocentrum_lima.AAC.1